MERIKLAIFLIFCGLLLKVTLPASIPTEKKLIQNLEEQIEGLTATLKLLKKESVSHTKRQVTTNCVLNENGRSNYVFAALHILYNIITVHTHGLL